MNEVTDVTDVRGRTKSGYVIAATHVAALDLALARGEVYQTSGLLGVETKRVEHLVFELPDIAGEEVPRVLKSWGKDQTPVAKLIHTENDGYEMILYRLLLKPSRGMRSPDRRDIRRRLVDVAGLPCSEWFVDDSDGRTVARLTLPRETKFGEGIVYRALATSGFFGDP